MGNDQFHDAVQAVLSAARAFLDTDATYGPTDERTERKKVALAEAVSVAMPGDVDVPTLHVLRGDLDDEDA